MKNQAESDVDKAELAYRFAGEDRQKYIDGDFPLDSKDAEATVTLSQAELKRAQDKLDGSKRLSERKFITSMELEADQQAAVKAEPAAADQLPVTEPGSASNEPVAPDGIAQAATETVATAEMPMEAESAAPAAEPVAAPAPLPAAAPRKPVVAVRGDDRPGMRKEEPAAPGRGKFGDRKDAGRPPRGPAGAGTEVVLRHQPQFRHR